VGQAEEAGLDFYAQAWALAHFLASERGEGLARLLTDAADGRLRRVVQAAARRSSDGPIQGPADLQRALFEAYFGDLSSASAEFEGFIAAIVAPGGRGDVTAGRPPTSLSE
jgi:hypothetical protein